MSKQKDDSLEKSRLKQVKAKKLPQDVLNNQNLRIIQKNLVYVIGLSSNIANKDLLIKEEYFGQYGKINKLVVNKNKAYNPFGPNGPSYSAYITYSNHQEASIAILSIDNTTVDEHLLRASFGTTKYCTYYLKGLDCTNKECLYLHYIADQKDIIHRDDMNSDKSIFLEQQLIAIKIADIFNPEVVKKIKACVNNKFTYKLPTAESIFLKEIVIDNDPSNHINNKSNNYKNCRKKKYYGYENDEYYEENFINYNSNVDRYLSIDKPIDKSKVLEEVDSVVICERKNSDSFSNANKTSASNNNKKLNSLFKTKENKMKLANKETEQKDNNMTPVVKNVQQQELELNRSKSDMNEVIIKSNTKQSQKRKKLLFQKKERSRFHFVDSNKAPENEEKIDIPEFISEIINKKISLHYYFSKYSVEYDKKLEEKILSHSNSDDWVQFIKSIKTNYDEEKRLLKH